jgi:hypothetical protein
MTVLKYHSCVITVLKYHTVITVLKYHTVITVLKYHSVRTVLKYHTVITVLKYHTVMTDLKYHTVITVLESNKKIMETEAISIPLTRIYDCSLSDLVHVYNSLKSDGVIKLVLWTKPLLTVDQGSKLAVAHANQNVNWAT